MNKRIELSLALAKHIENIEWLKRALLSNNLTPEQVGSKLRSRSIELGTIACMPFREVKLCADCDCNTPIGDRCSCDCHQVKEATC